MSEKLSREQVRQFAFDIVMTECGLDDQDSDDQADATERVDAWMEHWDKTGGADLEDALIIRKVDGEWPSHIVDMLDLLWHEQGATWDDLLDALSLEKPT